MTEPEEWIAGYMQGIADAGAILVGVVASELGPDSPLVDRMVVRLGSLGHRVEDDERPDPSE